MIRPVTDYTEKQGVFSRVVAPTRLEDPKIETKKKRALAKGTGGGEILGFLSQLFYCHLVYLER